MTYSVKEMFYTIQGEGAHAGTAAVFVRFAGCNLWSGREEDRQRDAARGCCALWCDTDFRGTDGTDGGRYDAARLAATARALAPASPRSTVAVLTGGEPAIQVDQPLVDALHAVGFTVHMETNGTHAIAADLDWVTVSPKHPAALRIQRCSEVKAVLADADPEQWVDLAPVRFIQPLWSPIDDEVGVRRPAIGRKPVTPAWCPLLPAARLALARSVVEGRSERSYQGPMPFVEDEDAPRSRRPSDEEEPSK